jgi:hypothetical protein
MAKRSATKSHRAESRAQRRETNTAQSVLHGAALRPAARAAHMPKSTLHDRAVRAAEWADGKQNAARGRKPDLTSEEESVVAEILIHFADRAVPMSRKYAIDAVDILLDQMDETRRGKLRFVNGIPGETFLRSFENRQGE